MVRFVYGDYHYQVSNTGSVRGSTSSEVESVGCSTSSEVDKGTSNVDSNMDTPGSKSDGGARRFSSCGILRVPGMGGLCVEAMDTNSPAKVIRLDLRSPIVSPAVLLISVLLACALKLRTGLSFSPMTDRRRYQEVV